MKCVHLGLLAGLLLAGACGGKGAGTSGGSSIGTGGGTGGSTGGGTGGVTTGGTGTGGTAGSLGAGTPCRGNALCASGVCGTNGSGRCCSIACATSDGICGAIGCDETGTCLYPASATACATDFCTGHTLTQSACNSAGGCAAGSPVPCPDSLQCSDATHCATQCGTSADCVTGFYCDTASHACLAQQLHGACTTNEACTSGVCGVAGFGHCCLTTCDTSDPTCGAKDCDSSGNCSFPGTETSCGPAASCSVTTETAAATCNHGGNCLAPVVTDCTPYLCGSTSCLTACSDASNCAMGSFCDTGASACCTLGAGGTINVDGTTGKDTTACCGIGTNGACQTLTHAMALIDAAQAKNVTINATVNGGGGDWTATEGYPVVLGWGVELNAPGVFFLDSVGRDGEFNLETFDVNAYSASDTVGYASIVGSASSSVGVGMDSAGNQTGDHSVITVEDGNTLYIANASVNGSMSVYGITTSNAQTFLLTGSATLMLGQDHSGGVTGTVQIGNALGQLATDGAVGIFCNNTGTGGCTIEDAPLVGQSSVIIQGQEVYDIQISDSATVSLTSNPVIGIPPTAQGFNKCSRKSDGVAHQTPAPGVLIGGAATTVTFKNGVIQCIGGSGFSLESASGVLNIDNTLIQNAGAGIYVAEGAATVTNSTIQFNYIGVEQSQTSVNSIGSLDLSGGGNTIVCSSNVEDMDGQFATEPGISVYNRSGAGLNASNVEWDTSGPDYFDCADITACTCNLSSCTLTPGSDGMDAVEIQGTGPITTTGNTLSTTSCN